MNGIASNQKVVFREAGGRRPVELPCQGLFKPGMVIGESVLSTAKP